MGRCFNNAMALLVCLALIWLSARTVLLLLQAQRHSDEARLGRAFQQELRQRGLIAPRWFAVDGPPGGG
jgi:hypothetical protein